MEIQEHEYFYLVRWDFKIVLHFQLEFFFNKRVNIYLELVIIFQNLFLLTD